MEMIVAGLSDPYYPRMFTIKSLAMHHLPIYHSFNGYSFFPHEMTYQFYDNTLELLIDNYQGKFSFVPGAEFTSPAQADKHIGANDARLTHDCSENLDFPSWEDVLEGYALGVGSQPIPSISSYQPDNLGNVAKQGHEILGDFTNSFGKQECGSLPLIQGEWQVWSDITFVVSITDIKCLSFRWDRTFWYQKIFFAIVSKEFHKWWIYYFSTLIHCLLEYNY